MATEVFKSTICPAGTLVKLHTIPGNTTGALVDIVMCNHSAISTKVVVQIGVESGLSESDIVNPGTELLSMDVDTWDNVKIAPGESIFITSSDAPVVVRCVGSYQY
jgi:hypothetical protein